MINTKKVGFISLGCDKNRVDLEKIIYKFKSYGFEIVSEKEKANIIIINTCAFLESARQESVDTILEVAQLKNKTQLEKVVVTGCLNELQICDLQESLPEVDLFVKVKDNDKIIELINQMYDINEYKEIYNCKNVLDRVLTTPQNYAYLKIADGCNNFCSYCNIPFIRGRYKSELKENLINEAKNLCNEGVSEIILVAQDLTKYGEDLPENNGNLVALIRELSKIKKLKWIRLLYCYPENITDELIDEIANNTKLCKYIDIPLQHINNRILKQMNRRGTKEDIETVINKLRKKIPDIAIRTTFILGFPGETDEEFNELNQFVKDEKLSQVGFFEYSNEEGTRSYNFKPQIPKKIKDSRLKAISQTQFNVLTDINQKFINKKFEVVVDSINNNIATCRSQYLAPNVDSVIYVTNDNSLKEGNYYNVVITNIDKYDFKGEKTNE